MGEEVLSMSLDDIINKNKTKTASKESTGERKPRASGHDERKGARAGARPVRDKGRGGEDRAPGLLRVVVKGSGVQKGGGMRSSRPAGAPRDRPPVDPEVLDGSAKWQHDLFDDFEELPRRNLQQRLRGPSDGFRLLVSNLADGVTEEDIKELFESCGTLKFACINWDRSGRSTGTAEVVYESKAGAAKAKSQFDGVDLDGQPMKIEVHQASTPGELTLSSGIRVGTMRSAGGRGIGRRENVAFARAVVSATGGGVGSRRGRGPSRGARTGGGGGARGGGGSRRVVSQADLDKDLENYMQE